MLLDRHRHLKKRVYRGIWDLIRQYKTEEWWVRVTDNEKNIRFVGLNRPVTVKEEFTKKLEAEGMPPEQIEQTIGKLAQDPMQGQMLAQVRRACETRKSCCKSWKRSAKTRPKRSLSKPCPTWNLRS